MRFSIRELFVAFTALSCVLVGFAYYGLLGASFITFIIGAMLIQSGRRTHRGCVARTGVTLSVLSFVITSLALAGWVFLDIGPIYTEAEFPHEFKNMVEIASADTADAKIWGLGSFIDTEHVWRLSLSPSQLDQVIAKYGLEIVPDKNVPKKFWQSFPILWRPSQNANSLFYSSPEFPALSRGPDGDLASLCIILRISGSTFGTSSISDRGNTCQYTLLKSYLFLS